MEDCAQEDLYPVCWPGSLKVRWYCSKFGDAGVLYRGICVSAAGAESTYGMSILGVKLRNFGNPRTADVKV